MASTMASAKSCPCAMATKGLGLATPKSPLYSFGLCVESSRLRGETEPRRVPEKGNGPRKDPRPLHHVPLTTRRR